MANQWCATEGLCATRLQERKKGSVGFDDECSGAVATHPEYVEETPSAFWATLPDPSTGACGYEQIPVYRLWNARADSNHRYTTDPAIKAAMIARGYVAEGYGPNAVAMCTSP